MTLGLRADVLCAVKPLEEKRCEREAFIAFGEVIPDRRSASILLLDRPERLPLPFTTMSHAHDAEIEPEAAWRYACR